MGGMAIDSLFMRGITAMKIKETSQGDEASENTMP